MSTPTTEAAPAIRFGPRFSLSGRHAAGIAGDGLGRWWVEAWTFPEEVGGPVVRDVVAGDEPWQTLDCQVLPLDDGRILLSRSNGGVQRILVSTVDGPWQPLARVDCLGVRLLPDPSPGGLALAVGTHVGLASTVWRLHPDEPALREVASLPGLLDGGLWLDDSGRRLAVSQAREGRLCHLAVDTATGVGAPLPGLDPGLAPVLAAPSSGLLVVASDRAGCGWTALDGSRPVVFPAGMASTPRRRVWPVAVDPAGRRVLLRIGEQQRSELAVYDTQLDELEPVDLPAGVVGDVVHWGEQRLVFPFGGSSIHAGLAELRGGPGGHLTLHGAQPSATVPSEQPRRNDLAPAAHPLEPLTAEEISAASAILRRDRGLDEAAQFVSIELHEPPKRAVLGGERLDREAFVVLRDRRKLCTVEAVVSLSRDEVRSWREVPGVQAIFTIEELAEGETVVRTDSRWREAMLRRGVTDLSLVTIDMWPSGNAGPRDDPGQGRLVRALCCVRSGRDDNSYARPVEGLDTVVDLDWMEVVQVVDHGVVPLPPAPGNYRPELMVEPGNVPAVDRPRQDLRPIEITQPDGPSFTVDGHAIAWQKWRLRFGFTPREGLVLHQVGYADRGRVRPILYRASLSELYVPYGDPHPIHRIKNVFDEGEWGLGFMLNSLELGCDCLGEIRYFDVVFNDGVGSPVTVPNAICLHEEDFGVVWKHTDLMTGHVETRRQRRLVLSCFATANNYDYGFFWYFYLDGTIEFEAKLTGIVATGAFPGQGPPPPCGTALAPGLYAPNHQHFFNVRLDMCVDGERNSVYEVDSVALPDGPENPAGNAWVARPTLLATESQAQRRIDPFAGRYWKVVNPSVRGALDQPVGYQLVPGDNVAPLAGEGSQTRRRAGFAYHHLWVTAYDPAQRYASGDYPNQRPGDDGLPVYVRADRSLADTDLVLWYTFGANHVVRPEDWPVMPVSRLGFHLAPTGFFDGNPALDLPRPERPCHAPATGGTDGDAG